MANALQMIATIYPPEIVRALRDCEHFPRYRAVNQLGAHQLGRIERIDMLTDELAARGLARMRSDDSMAAQIAAARGL